MDPLTFTITVITNQPPSLFSFDGATLRNIQIVDIESIIEQQKEESVRNSEAD
jgi:hypothetical protein